MRCVDNWAIGISSVEVVSFLLILNLFEEHAGTSTTSADRNPHPDYLATKLKNSSYFGYSSHNFKF
ncbi:hypothetical protein [Clostridium saccharobutylicum]|uniref:hypothetical protein n=1 Tax=Clostridium saccharobutylicum TaxID=169679 RepID=UPI0005A2AEB9|nr:hypothetical protein [Clostridium saccharobutylicum]MBA8897049.1 hypothetical protein [Clostridium saccharobutylicum]MBC2435900.1 hypothetical protein [Clostridium saccharobutylicum]MBC2445662.1 hypothetical protein [Clostridium saccharobutylicum]MBC2494918.1 hypothetical protein [Clostridium saccharobutylicum]MBC2567882.1 hypothetical protein [Clostridium saccharobutylicum]